MATNSLLQYLQATDGSGVALGATVSNRRQVERFIAKGAIAAGDVVAFSFADGDDPGDAVLYVAKSAADKHCCGIALTDAAAAGDEINVIIGGVAESAVKGKNDAGNAAISSGDFLCQGDDAGFLYKYTAGTDAMVHAIAVDDVASAGSVTATVIFLKQF